MILQGKIKAQWIGVAVGVLLAVGLGLLLHRYTLGKKLVNSSYDFLLVLRGDVRADEAVLVYLDEKSYEILNQPLNIPLDRALHARLVDRLTAAGARAIVFDIVFGDPAVHGPGADAALSEAVKRSDRVILAADKFPTDYQRWEIITPIDALMDAAAGVGSDDVEADSDVVVRKHTQFDPTYFPTLSWAAAKFVQAPVTLTTQTASRPRWINYYGPANFLVWVRYSEVLDSKAVPDAFFANKVVFVGARSMTKLAAQRKDEYANPFTFWSNRRTQRERGGLFMPGVEIQATAFLNLLRGDWLVRTPFPAETAIIILIGIFAGAGLIFLNPVPATALGLAAMIAVMASSYLLFANKYTWSPWLILEVQVFAALLWSVIFNSVQLYVQKRLAEQSLSLYLSPKLVKKFSKNPKLLLPGAEKQLLTILFSDIANFTSISEGMDSDELARLMNNYFHKAVSECIHRTDGTIVKYIGDAVFAFWNAPEEHKDHQERACQAALLFKDQGVQYINGKPLYTRIGLHTGVANVGNFGSTERVDYTALGENINLASRMEGLNKHLGTQLLITGETRAGIGDQFILRFLGLFRLKGFDRSVEVYELVGRANEPDDTQPWRETFDQAVGLFQKKDFAAAREAFQAILQIRPDDGPADFYLARLDELQNAPLPDSWKGEIELKEK